VGDGFAHGCEFSAMASLIRMPGGFDKGPWGALSSHLADGSPSLRLAIDQKPIYGHLSRSIFL
jgi:hypothetical protein